MSFSFVYKILLKTKLRRLWTTFTLKRVKVGLKIHGTRDDSLRAKFSNLQLLLSVIHGNIYEFIPYIQKTIQMCGLIEVGNVVRLVKINTSDTSIL